MKNLKLLGLSRDTIAVIFDAFQESYGIEEFQVFTNIQLEIIPKLPVLDILYQIKKHEDLQPQDGDRYFFGTAGAITKRIIYDFFYENYGITRDQYLNIVMPLSYIFNSSVVHQGTMIEPCVVVGSQSTVGFGTSLKRGVLLGHHNQIGEFCDINPGVVLSGNVIVGDNCIIGSGAIVKDNINIGENTIIGVGSVVTKDIPANKVAYGNPCRVMRDSY